MDQSITRILSVLLAGALVGVGGFIVWHQGVQSRALAAHGEPAGADAAPPAPAQEQPLPAQDSFSAPPAPALAPGEVEVLLALPILDGPVLGHLPEPRLARNDEGVAAELAAAPAPQHPLLHIMKAGVAALAAEAAPLEGRLEAMHEEMTTLRKDLADLKEVMNLLVREIMADLQEENEQLREELLTMYTLQEQGLPALPALAPRREQASEGRLNMGASAPAPSAPAQPFHFELIDEWGRSPEDAMELGPSVTSLKGIVGLVPANSSRDDLEQLGRDLRNQYAAYDNLNIEVFDERSAAEGYVVRQVNNPLHRVLSVSKHRASGRDVILVSENGILVEVRP